MKTKVEYTTEEERQQALTEYANLILVEEQNITEGNFLIFSDVPLEKEIVYVDVPQERLNTIEKQLATLSDTTDFLLGM